MSELYEQDPTIGIRGTEFWLQLMHAGPDSVEVLGLVRELRYEMSEDDVFSILALGCGMAAALSQATHQVTECGYLHEVHKIQIQEAN